MNAPKLICSLILLTGPIIPASAYDCEINGLRFDIVNKSGVEYALLAPADAANVTMPESFDYAKGDVPENRPRIDEGRKPYGMKEIVIPATVTHGGKTYAVKGVADGAIMAEPTLEKVVLPANGLLMTGNYNFLDCPVLKEIVNIDNLSAIGNGCFVNVPDLRGSFTMTEEYDAEYDITNGLGAYSFRNCGLEKITLCGLPKIFDGCFNDMPNLRETDMSHGIGAIGDGAFCDCPMLEAVDFRSDMDGTGPYQIGASFKDNTGLKKVYFARSMDSGVTCLIAGDAFNGCTALEEIHMEDGIPTFAGTPFAGGNISKDATVFIYPGNAETIHADNALSFIRRIVEVPVRGSSPARLHTAVKDLGSDFITIEWEPAAGANGYYYTLMENSGSFATGPTASDFSDRALPETWTANNPGWTDDPTLCSGIAPSFLLAKSGDYIDITAYRTETAGETYDNISMATFNCRPNGSNARLNVYAVTGSASELVQVFYLSGYSADNKTQNLTIDCVANEALPYSAEYFRLQLEAPEGVSATIDDVSCTYSSMLQRVAGTDEFTPIGSATTHTFRNLEAAHRYHVLITYKKEDGQYYEACRVPLVRTLSTPAAIEDVETDQTTDSATNRPGIVYDLTGRAVKHNVIPDEARTTLSPGIYILNGRKFCVR